MEQMAERYLNMSSSATRARGTSGTMVRRGTAPVHPPADLFEEAMSGGEAKTLGRWGEALAAAEYGESGLEGPERRRIPQPVWGN